MADKATRKVFLQDLRWEKAIQYLVDLQKLSPLQMLYSRNQEIMIIA